MYQGQVSPFAYPHSASFFPSTHLNIKFIQEVN
jgi:hypothetical protein